MWNSQIQRITSGYIDTVNDTIIGGMSGISGVSKFSGQLGAPIFLDDAQLSGFYQSATPVYGGRFRYVQLASGASAVVRGQLVFWDITAADNLYRVTTSEAGTTRTASMRAGVVLNASWTAGNYGYIQDVGPCYVKFRAVLTAAGATGSAVYAAAVGAGADNGLADVISSANPTLFSDVSLMQSRFLGSAIEAPTGGGTKLVYLNFLNVRG